MVGGVQAGAEHCVHEPYHVVQPACSTDQPVDGFDVEPANPINLDNQLLHATQCRKQYTAACQPGRVWQGCASSCLEADQACEHEFNSGSPSFSLLGLTSACECAVCVHQDCLGLALSHVHCFVCFQRTLA